MNVSEQIDYDVQFMRAYFRQLFVFADSAASKTPELIEGAPNSAFNFQSVGVSHLVRVDMACNVYSLADFWLANLCTHYQQRGRLSVSFEDFRKSESKSNDLQRYRKYLTKVVSLDLTSAQDSFHQLNALREVRNCLIRSGGHVPEKKRKVLARIPGISLHMSLVVVSEAFIWESLDHASQYLQAVAEA
jgi:hypothetical protein